jgi:GTPase SAR1 family protein
MSKDPQGSDDRYGALREELQQLPHISDVQVEQWVELQRTIDASQNYLIRAVPQARQNVEEAQKILAQRTYTLVFFGGTGVGKSTLINALLGRNLLPTGAVTAVTGTIIYIEQAEQDEPEALTFNYWSRSEFASRVLRLCQLAEIEPFDITSKAERADARETIAALAEQSQDEAKTEQDEYLEILVDCLDTFDVNEELFLNGPPEPQVFELDDQEALRHLREDGYKGSPKRQIRLVKSATFRILPRAGQPNLLMDGYLRIVDVPGLGAGMRLHEAITLEEMKREDAIIVLVTDAGRQRVDEMKSMASVNWIKENRLRGLSGSELDEAAAKIFLAVNGLNVRQAFDRLNAGLPESEREVREVTRHIAPNYWERYADRGNGRPYFQIMAPPALYVQDPANAPQEFASETERVLKVFADQLAGIDKDDPLHPDVAGALLELSEVPLLRDRLTTFIREERVRSQLREAASRVRNALQALRYYFEKQLAGRGVHPPFDTNWESLQERRYENVLIRQRKDLPRAFHLALLDLSQRTNSSARFRDLLQPALEGVTSMVLSVIQREIETLLESYGTEHWDDRDVTYDSLVWGASGIEVPIKRILYQVELAMQEAVSSFIPDVGDVISAEFERTLQAHDLARRLVHAAYGQVYDYALPDAPGEQLQLGEAFERLVQRVARNYRETCRQSAMYELMRPERSVHHQVQEGEQVLALPDDELLLDVILHGPDRASRAPAPSVAPDVSSELAADEDEVVINILDDYSSAGVLDIKLGEETMRDYPELGATYAERLENIARKTNQIFEEIMAGLFGDEHFFVRLRRLFWLEVTLAERDFNNYIVNPMMRQHDRNLPNAEMRQAMEVDLENVSDVEELMRTWEGLHELETGVAI